MNWEAQKAWLAKWEKARTSEPAPVGSKRCMNCLEVMPWDSYCECMKKTSEEMRAKARRASHDVPKKKVQQPKPEVKDQGSLF